MTSDFRARLEELRDEFSSRLADATDRDATAMGRLLKDIEADLAKIPGPKKAGNPIDEIAKRRAARGAGSAKSQRSAGADQG